FDDAAVLDPSAGKQQQLVVRAIGNPDIVVLGDTNAHQSEEFFLEGEIVFGGDRFTVEIHYKDFPVKAADPDTVFRHGRAPADAVNADAGEAGDRRGKCGPVGGELNHAATRALVDAGLRSGQPVLTAPKIAVRIKHQTSSGIIAAAREGQREGEVVRNVNQIRREGRTLDETSGSKRRRHCGEFVDNNLGRGLVAQN